MYEGDDPQTGGIYMIHPEFLDPSGVPLADDEPVPLEGTASMWVLTPQMRTAHQARSKWESEASSWKGRERWAPLKLYESRRFMQTPPPSLSIERTHNGAGEAVRSCRTLGITWPV